MRNPEVLRYIFYDKESFKGVQKDGIAFALGQKANSQKGCHYPLDIKKSCPIIAKHWDRRM